MWKTKSILSTRKPLSVAMDDLFQIAEQELFGDFFSKMESHFKYEDHLPYNEYEAEDRSYNIEITAAGYSKDDIEIETEGKSLYITISKDSENTSDDGKKYFTKRISKRNFKISRTIPDTYDIDKIMGSFKDGLLKITIPCSNKPKSKRIPLLLS